MFYLLWNWISGICRQKRILVILCTFGCSFILLNYSLLSSSSSSSSTTASHQSRDLFSNAKDELDVIIVRSSGQEKYDKLPNRKQWELQSSSHKKIMQMLIASKLSYNTDIHSITKAKAYPKVEETNDFHAFRQFNSESNQSKSGVFTSPSGHKNPSTTRVINMVKQDTANPTSNNNILNYSNEDRKTDIKHLKETSFSSSTTPLFLEESIIDGNKENSINNNLSDSISSLSPSSLSSSSSPFHLHSRNSFFPETILKNRPSKPSPPSSKYLSLNTGRHNSKNGSNMIIAESNSPTLSRNYNSSPFNIPSCNTPTQLRRVQKRKKNLTVIENFIMGWKRVKCNETITYTTHGDYRYLDNLVPLVERWNGPISLSIYAPGTDLEKTLEMISYLKLCTSSKIDEWVTFHLIYDVKFSKRPTQNYNNPGDILWLDGLYQTGKWRDCSKQPTFNKFDYTFRIENGLLYPINIARNIARSAAKTFFVLASDIELYPSINLIPNFMKMFKKLKLQRNKEGKGDRETNSIKTTLATVAESLVAKILFPSMSTILNISHDDKNVKNGTIAKEQKEDFQLNMQRQGQQQGLSNNRNQNRHVFVLPVFEVKKDVLPCQVETKEQLLTLMKKRAAVIFHHSICPQCHTFPKFEEWKVGVPSEMDKKILECGTNGTLNAMNLPVHPMKIFQKAKRKFPYQLWEPIFIGTKDEPIYDERLSWEGLRDKMVSGYVMCALDYDFYILDNAFLVHKPGIRKVVHIVTKTVQNQDRLINYRIRSELLRKFGKHDECAL